MELTRQEVIEIRDIVKHYQMHNVSLFKPQYAELTLIIDKLSQLISNKKPNENIH